MKNARGETAFKHDSDDVILNKHFHGKPNRNFEYRNNHRREKYHKTWDADDVILNRFDQTKRNSHHSNDFKRNQRNVRNHIRRRNLNSDDTILGTDFNMDSFFNDLDKGDQDYQQIFV